MLVYFVLAACALVTVVIVMRYDLYEREPLPLLLLAVLLGGGLMALAGQAQIAVLSAGGARVAANWNTSLAAAAASTEELAKLLSVALIALFFPKWFNEPVDGLIYGAMAGLGAALLESVDVLGEIGPSSHLPAHEPIRLAGHLVMGGIGGFGLGMMFVWRRAWPVAVFASLAGAWALHFLWDLIAFSARDRGAMTRGHTAAAVGLMLGGMVIFRWLVHVGVREDARRQADQTGEGASETV